MNRKFNPIISIGFIVFILAGFFLRYLTYDAAYINTWVTRDFDRAFNLVDGVYFPLAGPELSNGGRLPGPFLYLLLAIPILIKHSYESIIAFNFILNCASLIGLFFVVRKFFGIHVGLLSTIFLSFNLTHIGAAGFPFNPSYTFLLIPLYLWFVFELSINRNINFLPAIFVIISLGIQLHYSFAILLLAPILLLFLLRIKVSFKAILISILLVFICLTPYLLYLKQTFIPEISRITIFGNSDISIVNRVIKFVFLGNTIDLMTFKNGIKRGVYFNTKIAAVYYMLTFSSMCFLAFRIYKVAKEKGFLNADKELSLFLVFYAPGLIYETTSPLANFWSPHNWYFFVFTMQQMIFISYFLVGVFLKIEIKWQKQFYMIATLSLITVIGINAYGDIRMLSKKLKKELFSGEFSNFKYLHGSLMKILKLTPEEYTSRVYFEGFPPGSLKVLESLKKSNNYSKDIQLINYQKFEYSLSKKMANLNFDKNRITCFFIISGQANLARRSDFITYRLVNYKSDKSILRSKINLKIHFSTHKWILGWLDQKQFILISEYIPKQNQSCYTNGLNKFVVENNIRNLLIDAKSLDAKKDLDMKVISKEENYDSNNELTSFKGEYLVFDKFTSSPFKLNLTINNSDKGYIFNIDILKYYYYPLTKFVNEMDIAICNSQLTTRLNQRDCSFINVFPENTLASTIYAANQEWKKTILFPMENQIFKNRHFLKLVWSSKKIADIDYDGLYTQDTNKTVIPLN